MSVEMPPPAGATRADPAQIEPVPGVAKPDPILIATDLRRAFGGLKAVDVDRLADAGAPRLVTGNQANAGQGADESPIIQSYRTASRSENDRTRAERRVEEIFGVGPMPPRIPD